MVYKVIANVVNQKELNWACTFEAELRWTACEAIDAIASETINMIMLRDRILPSHRLHMLMSHHGARIDSQD
jgi:hypothetical protein